MVLVSFIVFIVDPFSVAAIDGTTVEFTCTANNTDTVTYRVNDTSATSQSVVSKGFTELNAEEVDSLTRRNLTVTVSSLYNNTEIFCRAVGSPMNTDSEIAILIVQGVYLDMLVSGRVVCTTNLLTTVCFCYFTSLLLQIEKTQKSFKY